MEIIDNSTVLEDDVNAFTNEESENSPLPIKTMLVLCVVIISEPLSLTILFPFVYFMVRDFGQIEHEEDIGYYVGYIATCFSFAQLLTTIFWGWLSDRVGRRPILLLGLMGNSITMLSFGLSKSLQWAIMSRALCGLLNGNTGVAKSVLGEISNKSNRNVAFSLISVCYNAGMILGPALGGLLEHPVEHRIIPRIEFFVVYPYFLPCLLGAGMSFLGFLSGLFFLPETAKSLKVCNKINAHEEEGSVNINNQPNEQNGNYDSVHSKGQKTFAKQITTFSESSTVETLANDNNLSPSYTERTPLLDNNIETVVIAREAAPKNSLYAIYTALAYGLLCFQSILFIEIYTLWTG